MIHLPLLTALEICEDIAHELEDQAPDVEPPIDQEEDQ
jgi:hypothetical protein